MISDESNNRGLSGLLRHITPLLLMGAGGYLLLFGEVWSPPLLGFMAGFTMGAWIELIVLFLPMLPIYAGVLIASSQAGK